MSASAQPHPAPVVVLRLFAQARDAAGTGRDQLTASTVGEALDEARRRYGPAFAEVVTISRVWVNGEPAAVGAELAEGDEVAVLPPVSGGCGRRGRP